jgi:hypothetical protein
MTSNAIVLVIITAGTSSLVTWLVQRFLTKTVGTNYRTQEQCEECSVRASMEVIRALVVELAIKAGVPAHEVAQLVAKISGPASQTRPGGRRDYDPNTRP